MAELADAPDLGSGGSSVQVRPLLPVPKRKTALVAVFLFSIGNRARHVRERICAAYSFEDTTTRTYPRQVLRPLLPVPNSRNPNLVPVGDGFGFLFVFDDLDVISKNDI